MSSKTRTYGMGSKTRIYVDEIVGEIRHDLLVYGNYSSSRRSARIDPLSAHLTWEIPSRMYEKYLPLDIQDLSRFFTGHDQTTVGIAELFPIPRTFSTGKSTDISPFSILYGKRKK